MFRKDLLEMLRVAPRSVADIAAQLELEPKDVEDDLRHLLKRVRHTGYRVTITPARCRETWISPPLIRIEGAEPP